MIETTPRRYNETIPGNDAQPFSRSAAIATAVFILPMAVFGIFANLVTIIVITKSKKLLKSIFNLMILSLCVSDLFSAIISPLSLYRRTIGNSVWKLTEALCKLFWAGDHWTSYVTSLHILLFACIRLASIKSPIFYNRLKKKYVIVVIVVIWIISFGSGFIPMWIWFGLKRDDRPADGFGSNWPDCTLYFVRIPQFQKYAKIAYSIFFYFPLIVIIILSPTIAILIIKQRRKRIQRRNAESANETLTEFEKKAQHKENSAIIQLVFIVGSYMLGYIPISAFLVYATDAPQKTMQEQMFHWNFGTVAYILLRLSECLNPLFYNVASSKMRKETILFLKRPLKNCCVHNIDRSSAASSSTATSPRRNLRL